MGTLAAACGSILIVLLAGSLMLAMGLPMHLAMALTAFGACLLGLLAMSVRLAFEDQKRGHHHHDETPAARPAIRKPSPAMDGVDPGDVLR